MPNIRVNDLCEGFKNLSNSWEKISEPLAGQLKTLCNAAAKGNPAVLEKKEAAAVDKNSGDIYSEYGGVFQFAKVMTNTSLANPVADSFWSEFTLAKLYEGFLEIPVSEPPFVVGKFVIDKVAENMETGVQTLLVNGDVAMDITPEKAVFNFEVLACDFNRHLPGSFGSKTPRFDLTNYLPFMPGYAAEDINKTQNAKLEEQQGKAYYVGKGVDHTFAKGGPDAFADYERSFYVDERGTFFFDRDKDETFGNRRVYVSEPLTRFWREVNGIDLNKSQTLTYSDYLEGKRLAAEVRRNRYRRHCFTGDMQLETDDGNRLAFDKLYDIYRSGADLPYVRVWNPEENQWTYQQPEKIFRHLLPYAGEIRLIQTSSGQLKATPNHFLWARRGQDEFWLRAGEIEAGDYLLADTEGNGEKVWREVAANITMDKHAYLESIGQADETTLEVFNLTFGKGLGQYFNYAVCGGELGGECAVAHNGFK